ncbi:MAG: hypothetical protein KJO07_14955 [Deltaproteobacteria bacterium]|nr:hypothetical protein [Deltaproteobacteria bacterium]
MRQLLCMVLPGLCLFFSGLAACSVAAESDHINAVVGDRSWSQLRGTAPKAAGDSERIAVHLEWVESRLRERTPLGLDPQQRQRRARLLAELEDYRRAGRFPTRSDRARGRLPVWVDDQGTHCAVAHLVAASGDQDTVAEVQRKHRFDLVKDMKSMRLGAWAETHGFEVVELAMIQPTYDHGGVHVPTRREQEIARRRALAEARKPRPLTREVLERAVNGYVNRDHKRACFGRRTGRFELATKLRVTGGKRIRASVQVTPIGQRKPDRALSRCWTRRLRAVARRHLAEKNYRVRAPMTMSANTVVEIPDAATVEARFLSRPAYARTYGKSREQTLSQCLDSWPPGRLPAVLDVKVSSWNGDVSIRQDPAVRGIFGRNLRPWHCVGNIIRYQRVRPVPTYDHEFTISITRDGNIRVVSPR